MSGLTEVDEAVTRIRRTTAPFAVLQCTTMYPTPPEAIGIGALPVFRERYGRSEEHTSELQSLMRISYAVFCLKKKKKKTYIKIDTLHYNEKNNRYKSYLRHTKQNR